MTDTVSPAVPRAAPRAYAAFLSYSRALDAELAITLQRELERFAKPWHQRRALRVFRDDTNLSANADLWSSIVHALDDAEYLLLLASPQSARSPWVLREVEHWLRHRSPETLLIVVTAGGIAWSGTGFDPERTDCLPDPLLRAYPLEPRWVDLRTARGSTRPDPRLPAFRDAVADLAAPLRRVPKDELVGEDLRQFRRTRHLVRLVIAVLSVLTLLAGGAAAVAVHQTGIAEQQRAEAVHQQRAAIARELLTRADGARATDPRGAIRYALAAGRLDPGDAALTSLVDTVVGTRIEASLPAHTDFVRTVAVSPDGTTHGLRQPQRRGRGVGHHRPDPPGAHRHDHLETGARHQRPDLLRRTAGCWSSAPAAEPWSSGPSPARATSPRSVCCPRTAARPAPSPSAPTGGCWSPAATTTRSSSGTSPIRPLPGSSARR